MRWETRVLEQFSQYLMESGVLSLFEGVLQASLPMVLAWGPNLSGV